MDIRKQLKIGNTIRASSRAISPHPGSLTWSVRPAQLTKLRKKPVNSRRIATLSQSELLWPKPLLTRPWLTINAKNSSSSVWPSTVLVIRVRKAIKKDHARNAKDRKKPLNHRGRMAPHAASPEASTATSK